MPISRKSNLLQLGAQVVAQAVQGTFMKARISQITVSHLPISICVGTSLTVAYKKLHFNDVQ